MGYTWIQTGCLQEPQLGLGVFILRDVQPLLSLCRLCLEQTPEHNGAVLLQTGAGRWVD